jgi:DNA-binding response OmpR family regulator
MKVLVIEDNLELAESICKYLQAENYISEHAYNVKTAEEKLAVFSYDCILLDLMLPDGDGFEILRMIRRNNITSGLLIISARGGLDDKVSGLENGADDYLTKPFHLSELHARLKAIYRRKTLDGNDTISLNGITLDMKKMEVIVNDTPLDVTRKEYDLLLYFLINKGRVLSRQAIATHLWGDYTDNLSNFDFVYQHVKNLRKKINAVNGADYIETVYGVGYKFNTAKG